MTRYNEAYGTSFTAIEEVQTDCRVGLIDAPAGGYVTVYCNTGSAEQAFCEANGLTYVLMDSGEPYCVHHITLNTLIDSDCTQNGYRGGAVCLDCEKVFEAPEIIPPKGHVPVTLSGFAPTCTEYGATDGVVCDRCSEILTERQPIDPIPHADNDGDGRCDGCNVPMETASEQKVSFFEEIRIVFRTIIDRLLALFRRMFG